jgi:hypothetical protein
MPAETAAPGINPGSRRPEQIETDIAETRARIDRTVSALRDTVSTERMAGAATVAVRDLLAGRSNRLADAIRAHPLPVALVGVGLAWFALSLRRGPGNRQRPAHGADRAVDLTGDLSLALARIAADASRGSASLGRAATMFAGTAAADPLHGGARDYAAVADALASRVRLEARVGEDDWSRVDDLTPADSLSDALSHIADGLGTTLDLTRAALKQNLPDGLRVALGAHLHETATTLGRVHAIREAQG